MCLIDLQGNLDREYAVGFFLKELPGRRTLRERWPANYEENLERLANAGLPYDRKLLKCHNCGGMLPYPMPETHEQLTDWTIELGHTLNQCKQERTEYERPVVKCSNCGDPGHRVRDCTQPRKSRYGCRNCGYELFPC